TLEELEIGLNAVAAPVRGADGSVLAAVSVSGPSYRVTPQRLPELGELTRQTAEAVSRRMGYTRGGGKHEQGGRGPLRPLRGHDQRPGSGGQGTDSHRSSFAVSQCAQTGLARAQVVLMPTGEDAFWIFVRSSFAGLPQRVVTGRHGGVRPASLRGYAAVIPTDALKTTYTAEGGAVFARQIMPDVLAIDGLDGGTFALVDIDGARLDLARRIGERLVARAGKDWRVLASTDRRDVLDKSDFIVNSIEVAGRENVHHDYEIPMRYGVDQCIGDPIGPGGIFKALRTGPAWLEIVEDVRRVCPQAIVLNYTNPMSILTLAAMRATGLPVVGLCHSVQGTSRQLAQYLDVPYEDLRWRCAGINHNAWFTQLSVDDRDLYPRLREVARTPEVYEQDPVRFE